MVRASVRAIIHSLTLVDYFPEQTHKPYSNYRIFSVNGYPYIKINIIRCDIVMYKTILSLQWDSYLPFVINTSPLDDGK